MRGLAAILFCFAMRSAFGLGADLSAEARSAYLHGRYERAVELLTGASLSPEMRFLLGKANYRLRKTDAAIRELEKAVESEPSNSTYHLWLGRAYGQKASRASIFTAMGWARKVAKEFETAVKLSPGNLDARFDLLEFDLEAPGIVGGGKDKASAQVEAIAAANPRQGYTARAEVFEHDKQFDAARQELTKATVSFPDDQGSYIDLGGFLLRRDDYPGAETNARRALALQPDSLRAKLILNAALVALGKDVPQAEKVFAQMSQEPLRDESDPGFEEVYYWLGRAYQKQGDSAQARQAYQTALRFDPENAAAKSALAQLH
jgi:tetratricopeptide (TPR) repeat protein